MTEQIYTLEGYADLYGVVAGARRVFSKLLGVSLGSKSTAGACLYAAIITLKSITLFTPHNAVIRGGDGDLDGGLFLDEKGHGHYWVEVDFSGHALIVDIAADQFGLAEVIVSPACTLAGVYRPGAQDMVDEHVADLIKTMEQDSSDARE